MQNNEDWAQKVLQKEQKRQEEFEKKFPKRNQLKILPGVYDLLLEDEGKNYDHPEFGASVIFNVTDHKTNEKLVYFAKNEQLLVGLAKLGRPFAGKSVRITRTGKGMKDTTYKVELIGEPADSTGFSKPFVEQEYV